MSHKLQSSNLPIHSKWSKIVAKRIGQTQKMTYIDIMCEDTVDERIVKALRKKVNIASQVMGEELKAWI
jgi:hypothetical protein